MESSSMGVDENLDWPTRTTEVMISMASAWSALIPFSSFETFLNRKTSFVSVADSTEPVK